MRALPLLVLLLAGCPSDDGDDTADTDTDTDAADTDTTVLPGERWEAVQTALGRSCAFSTCHGGGSGSLQLKGSVDDHARLVDVPAAGKAGATLVVPGDPDGSYLLAKLEDAAGIEGDAMPPGSDLPAADLEAIRTWIAEGAEAPIR